MKRVTGIGGIFFAAKDPQKLKEWYERHLGIATLFLSNDVAHPSRSGYTVWNVFPKSSKMFESSKKEFVMNYRVEDLESLLSVLEKERIRIIGNVETDVNGKFASILDLEDNKVVLWEPGNHIPEGPYQKPDRVTGMGGIFFKTIDKVKLKEWYRTHLGFDVTEWGCTFRWIDPNDPDAKVPARTEWSPFPSDTKYLLPSEKEFMFNYRVKDLVTLLQNLKSEGVEIVGEIQEFTYGKFAYIMDPEMNKLELWEPVDDGF